MTPSHHRPLLLFDSLPDDLLLNILSRLYDDPRHLARLACVCCRFCKIVQNTCWKSRCEQALPSLVAELVSPSPPYEPPGGWASLQKLLVCCPGLWHSGVLLESWDFGLERELAWYEDAYKPDHVDVSSSDFGKETNVTSKIGESSSQMDGHNVASRHSCASGSGSEHLQNMDSHPSSHLSGESGCSDVQIDAVHKTDALPLCGESGDSDGTEATEVCKHAVQNDVIESSKRAFPVPTSYHMNVATGSKGQIEHVSGPMDLPFADPSINFGWKRKKDHCKKDRKRRRKDLSEQCHMTTCSGISREQGNKLLANRFRTDSLYICDWPGCIHPGEKRKYKLFRGIFKNFKHSHVWRNLMDMQAKATDLGCAFCVCKSTWDMVATFCLKRSIEYHDDGEPVVRAYVCENGHVAGTWTDRPMYNL